MWVRLLFGFVARKVKAVSLRSIPHPFSVKLRKDGAQLRMSR
jgi:hypothetical protein